MGENGKVVKPEPNQQEVYSLGKKFSPEYDYATTNEAEKGSSDYDYNGGDTYHVLERPSIHDSSDYDYAGGNDYHEVKPQKSNTSDYDYATCDNQQANISSSRNTQTRDSDYDHFGREPARANDHHYTTLSVAGTLEGGNDNEEVYSYNHLNEKAVSNINADSTYNTTASTRHKKDSSTSGMEDDYGYHHLGTESKKNLPQNEYDTTASAIRDLARLNGDEVSKACYGSAGLCTKHILRCGSGRIAIQEAFYMAGTACGNGVSDCGNINVNSIPLTGRRYNFSETELNTLYGSCSTQLTCSFRADRRRVVSFSAITYKCIITSTSTTTTQGTTQTFSSPKSSGPVAIVPPEQTIIKEIGTATPLRLTRTNASLMTATQGKAQSLTSQTSSGPFSVVPPDQTNKRENGNYGEKSTTGTVVGIIVPLCIIIAAVVIAVLIFRRRKIRQKGENGNVAKPNSKSQEVHSLEEKLSPDYDYATANVRLDLVPKAHDMPAPLKGSSDYNYAKCGDQNSNRDHHSSRNIQTSVSDYDHIRRQAARANGHYDTTVSVADILKGRKDKEEFYSYNHLNDKASNNADVDSTYNTTASTRYNLDASTNEMEDDYGYNRLGAEPKKNLPQNDYDTTASAIRDVSRMDGDMEDSTYDHAHLITLGCSSRTTHADFQESDYDHASPLNAANKDECKSHASSNGTPQEY